MQVDMDLPNVIFSTDALVGADAGLEVFGIEMWAPHLTQNFTSSEFSFPHFGQKYCSPFPLIKEPNNTGAHIAQHKVDIKGVYLSGITARGRPPPVYH
jgi:hypothetical protein